jgi:hypothetical protein
MIEDSSGLWKYLDADMRSLIRDGEFLVEDSLRHTDAPPTDFSYLVFPFAKLYEGFLKKLFRDTGIISDRDYKSDHFRIGKVLSPNIARILGPRSAYTLISDKFGDQLAARLWHTWKDGRNMVFHYFPHNFKRLSRNDAVSLIRIITNTMKESVELFGVG